MLGVAVQDAIAASLLAPSGSQLVLDQSTAPAPELDILLVSGGSSLSSVAGKFFKWKSLRPQRNVKKAVVP